MNAILVLTALLASLPVAVAAAIAQRGLLALGRPTRYAWLLAIVVMVALPTLPLIASQIPSSEPNALSQTIQRLPTISTAATIASVRFNDSTWRQIEHWFFWLWTAGSLFAFVRLTLAINAQQRAARQWHSGVVAGVPVAISRAFGPAVVGFFRPQIVIPRRITDWSVQEQALVLAHEREHIAAKDHVSIHAAAIAVACMPWNPFLWFAARQLRQAIEVDCDARVLRGTPNVSAYAELVLNVATWRQEMPANSLALGARALQQLESRIVQMAGDSRKRRPVTAFGLFVVAGLLTTYACASATRVAKPEPKIHVLEPIVTTAVSSAKPFTEFQVDKPAAVVFPSATPRYPDSLRMAGVEGQVTAQFVVNESGLADFSSLKILNSPNELFVQSVQATIPLMRFSPAEVKGVKVRQLVQQIFEFTIAR